jgi:hypothetical protein
VDKLEALERENERLRILALTLPATLKNAEAQGHAHVAFMVYGYEVVYTREGLDRWHTYLNDTAD